MKASITGKVLEFKATAKGGAQGINLFAALKDVWIHFIFLCGALLIAMVDLSTPLFPLVPANRSTQQSVLTRLNPWWCVFNAVPYYLVVHYAFVGRKVSLRVACAVTYLLQTGIIFYIMFIFWQPETWDPAYDVSATTDFGTCTLFGGAVAQPAIPVAGVLTGMYIPMLT